ncbi:sodium- and chloride-dependent creatine transporter 1-like [Pollicipes pollicipes]|uniref:sodium- and chloride-dependent creatine transporter 1-like n=1 Tax=Pollicipes pollicipes TaxID=41117 RepID=UPI0018856D0D|nr:sodium- and chloride-dependent creatine transporter 1-like [Pollicipes pollicipes]
MSTVRPRDQWSSQCDFIVSCIGYSVGLGNIWRFPYMCYKHGGGTFLLPYTVMLLAVGVPMYVMELALGQYAGLGPNKVCQKMSPLFSGLGYAMLLMTVFVCFTYNVVIAWAIFYAAASFTSELAWSRGIRTLGKIIHFTVIFPYFVLIVLFVLTAFLDGAVEGIRFFVTPDYHQVLSVSVWLDAASQVFFSLGCSMGGLITLASFNRFKNNCMRDAIVVGVVNTLTSVLFGLIVFSMLGFMASQVNKDVAEVLKTDLGLAFIVYPETLSHTSVAPLWSALFFSMVITLGLDSQIPMVETLTTAVSDEWPRVGERKAAVVVVTCAVFFAAGLSMCFNGGVLVFALVDHYSVSYSLFAIALVEVLVAAWVFGAERLLELMQKDMGITIPTPLRLYWLVAWKYLIPLVLACVLVLALLHHDPVSYRAVDGLHPFPAWADHIGLALAASPVLLLVAVGVGVAGVQLWRGDPLATLLCPTADWGTATPVNRGVVNEGFERTGQPMC